MLSRTTPTLLFLPLLSLSTLGAPMAANAAVQDGPDRDPATILVSGTGTVAVAPDRATLMFAVETREPSAAEASAGNALATNAVVAALREAHPDATVSTQGYSLQPFYNRGREPGEAATIGGYTALNQVQIRTDRLEAIGELLDAGIAAGANRVAGLTFEASDTEAARMEALREAVSRARAEAATMAEALGVTLSRVLQVQGGAEAPVPPPTPYPALRMAEAQVAPTPIEAGEHTVTARVTITYEIAEGR